MISYKYIPMLHTAQLSQHNNRFVHVFAFYSEERDFLAEANFTTRNVPKLTRQQTR